MSHHFIRLTHFFPQFQKWNTHFDGKLQNNSSGLKTYTLYDRN